MAIASRWPKMVYFVRRLQSVLNSAAKLTYHLRRSHHISDARRLHIVYAMKKLSYFPYLWAPRTMIYCVLQQDVEVVLHVKKCGVENPKMGIVYNFFVKKYTRFIFFCEYFPFYLWKWFLQRLIVCFWDKTQKIKYVIFSKMQIICFSALKIIEMLWKSFFDDNTEI